MIKYLFAIFFVLTNVGFANINNSLSKTDSVPAKRSVLKIDFLRIRYGELRLEMEKAQSKDLAIVYGIGLIYMEEKFVKYLRPNISYDDMRSDNYKGLELFVGNKIFIKGGFSITNQIFTVYERDKNFLLGGYYESRWCYSDYREDLVEYSDKADRDKFVFGHKILFGLQSKDNDKMVAEIYVGFGESFIRKLYWADNKIVDSEPLSVDMMLLLGVKVGFNLNGKQGKN